MPASRKEEKERLKKPDEFPLGLSRLFKCKPRRSKADCFCLDHNLTNVKWSQKMGYEPTAAAAAKSLQSCLTLCDPRDGSPSGSPVPGILQARTLEWVAISFSNTGK